jgi:hypothetical protein
MNVIVESLQMFFTSIYESRGRLSDWWYAYSMESGGLEFIWPLEKSSPDVTACASTVMVSEEARLIA